MQTTLDPLRQATAPSVHVAASHAAAWRRVERLGDELLMVWTVTRMTVHIYDWLRRRIEREAMAIEQAVEAALQDGRYGVKVWRWLDDTADWTARLEARVDPDTPYGHIYERPFGERPPG
jgi:hypothetical protein